jgi:hypothetical protein
MIGYRRNGGYAELVAVPGVNIIPKPAQLSWEEAAALPLVTVTAWHMLVTRANVQPGEDVLVHAAGQRRRFDRDSDCEAAWRARDHDGELRRETRESARARRR